MLAICFDIRCEQYPEPQKQTFTVCIKKQRIGRVRMAGLLSNLQCTHIKPGCIVLVCFTSDWGKRYIWEKGAPGFIKATKSKIFPKPCHLSALQHYSSVYVDV